MLDTWQAIFDEWLFASTLYWKLKLRLVCDGRIPAFGWYDRVPRELSLNTHHPSLYFASTFIGSKEHPISTPLHELVQAFLAIHLCKRPCCERFSHPSQGGEGSEGHGPPWPDIATLVFNTLQKSVSWDVENSA